MLRRIGLLVLALVSITCLVQAQGPAPNTDPRHIVVEGFDRPTKITSYWLTNSTQDDPSFAQPNLDDSAWRLRRRGEYIDSYWSRPSRVIWYRAHLEVPPATKDLAVSMNGIHGPFELYANGRFIKAVGDVRGPGTFGDMIPVVFHLPPDIAPDGKLVLALRTGILFTPSFFQGGISGDTLIQIGVNEHMSDERELVVFRSLTSNYTMLLIGLLVGTVASGLFFSSRAPEYILLAGASFGMSLYNIVEIYVFAHPVQRDGLPLLIFTMTGALTNLLLLEFVRRLLRRPWWKLFAITEGLLILSNIVLQNIFMLNPAKLSWMVSGPIQVIISLSSWISADIIVPIVLWRAWRKGNRDAGLVLAGLSVMYVLSYLSVGRQILIGFHLMKSGPDPFQRLPAINFNIAWSEVATFISFLSLLTFVVLRTIRIAREKAELASEIVAAQSVQTLLLAREERPTPGFKVETAYRPASEVGGDFFLVSPGEDGSLFAIVGDVSGKGMQAAMRVSLILGVLHRESSRTPAQVLMNLNRALLTQGEIGFTTACALLVHADGRYSFSNAGHLNPYVDGQEIVSPGALPLGLAVDFEYPTEYGHLDRNQRLVLLSDGVPEARSATTGALYGFDKLVTLTRLPANDIAETAHVFGQTDDITVLTLALA